jgi:hypothetical protein
LLPPPVRPPLPLLLVRPPLPRAALPPRPAVLPALGP